MEKLRKIEKEHIGKVIVAMILIGWAIILISPQTILVKIAGWLMWTIVSYIFYLLLREKKQKGSEPKISGQERQ